MQVVPMTLEDRLTPHEELNDPRPHHYYVPYRFVSTCPGCGEPDVYGVLATWAKFMSVMCDGDHMWEPQRRDHSVLFVHACEPQTIYQWREAVTFEFQTHVLVVDGPADGVSV